MNKLKAIPKLKTEIDQREFWLTHDSTEFLDWNQAKIGIFPNLKPTAKLISIRLPEWMLEKVKMQANRLDIPYQSLVKKFIASGLGI